MPRRSLLKLLGFTPFLGNSSNDRKIPVGLELYSVREELGRDLMGTLRSVAGIGYQIVEFFSPYLTWTPEYARQVRGLLDDLGMRCLSTHNGAAILAVDGLRKAIELNQILGSNNIIAASAGTVRNLDGWKQVADQLSHAADQLRPLGMRAGFHNHKNEFIPVAGKRPMDVIAAQTPRDVMLQVDVGTCLDAGSDPVAWIKANPGRISSIHCKDWSSKENKGYTVLFGEGEAPWLEIFQAAESVGGVEFYLIEQEGSRFTPMDTARRCLNTWRSLKR
jgi:sugar phosphate isomerase/epimerase